MAISAADDVASTIRFTDPSAAPTTQAATPALTQVVSLGPPAKIAILLTTGKNNRGAAAAQLILEALKSEGIFVFSEVLEHPGVKELQNHEQYAGHYALLEIFAYGEWADYVEKSDKLPKLTNPMVTKLKQLTIVSLMRTSRTISYPLLFTRLSNTPNASPLLTPGPQDVKDLESLIINSIYAGVINGRLDQRRECLEIDWGIGRDVQLPTIPAGDAMDTSEGEGSGRSRNTVEALRDNVSVFQERIKNVLETLDGYIQKIEESEQEKEKKEKMHTARLTWVVDDVARKLPKPEKSMGMGGFGLGRFGGGGSSMEVDEDYSLFQRGGSSLNPFGNKRFAISSSQRRGLTDKEVQVKEKTPGVGKKLDWEGHEWKYV